MTETASPLPLVGMILGDTYRITRLVAVGGMGELYEASHLRLAGRYAIKVLLPQFAAYEEVIARFQREAEITSSLRHPNIVSALDFNTTPDGRAFLAMELLEGRDLGEELARQGAMSVERALGITDQVVSALSAAHAHGVVHRDLKPQNLFISSLAGDGREMVKVLDFGISKMREAHTKLTREHSIMGTPQYMAPEQALGNAQAIDHRTDQFSLAAITYELLAGQPPFSADSVSAVLYQVVHEAPPALANFRRDIPAAVERVLRRALEKDPAARFPNIGEFGRTLLAAGAAHLAARATAGLDAQPDARPLAVAATVLRATSPAPRPRPAPTRQRRMDTTFGASTAQLSNDDFRVTTRRTERPMALVTLTLLGLGLAGAGIWYAQDRKDGQDRPPPRAAYRPPLPSRLPPSPPPPVSPPTPEPVPQAPQAAPAPESTLPSLPTEATAPPVVAPESTLEPAPLRILNPPSGLRVKVDGQPVDLPVRLARKPGSYTLRFESPGRQPQTIEVDALAPSHQVRLTMPRLPGRRVEESMAEEPELTPEAPPPAETPAPEPRPRPSLIEDVEDSPAPDQPASPEKPNVPLIDEP